MAFPNGAVITPDDKTLIIAETFSARLTAFNIMDD
ncbi:MAG: SMP-30/gluconolactonase/LRE family protein, partial [Promethearchaeota archaeon]